MLLLVAIVAIPLIFRYDNTVISRPDDVLVVISPHTEFICDEFASGFSKWYQAKTGRTIVVDVRHIGGSTETQRFLDSVYDNAFRTYWETTLRRPWNYAVQTGYCKPQVLDDTPEDDTLAQSARRAFINSNISCGVDVLFGGGTLVFETQAGRGQLVPSFLDQLHPEWFTEAVIPLQWAGDYTRDPHGLWYGAVFSSYGIIYNKDSLTKANFQGVPKHWEVLTDKRFFAQVALTDPTKSGAAKKALELIIQEQMQLAEADLLAAGVPALEAEQKGIEEGWLRGLRVLQKMAANARYFTDKSTKPALDVAAGDCAVGVILDCYGLAQQQNIIDRGGADRMGFILPDKGSTLEPDPIGLLRGAPHPELGKLFIEYVLSVEGQKIWAYKTGTPGGPERYTLRRLPIRRDLFTPEHRPFRVDIDLDPYADPNRYIYHAAWTAPIFATLHIVMKSLCIDPHMELQSAWAAILEAELEGRTQAAEAARLIMEDLTGLSYRTVKGSFTETITEGTPLQAVTTQAALANRFAEQYQKAERVARGE